MDVSPVARMGTTGAAASSGMYRSVTTQTIFSRHRTDRERPSRLVCAGLLDAALREKTTNDVDKRDEFNT